MTKDKRYQVFVSSTYKDLVEERQHVIRALIELNCIPCSMEYFPAANEEVWAAIQELIRGCDYYLVVVGGSYGSEAADGISYTRKEYEYAIEIGIPVMAFPHKNPGSIPKVKSETSSKRQRKLDEFLALCRKRLCKDWENPSDLAGKVTAGLVHLMNRHPSVGWVRGDRVPDERAAETINRLRTENDRLKQQLAVFAREGPPGGDQFAHGEDQFTVKFLLGTEQDEYGAIAKWAPHTVSMSWNVIFQAMAMKLMTAAAETQMLDDLQAVIQEQLQSDYVEIEPEVFQTIKTQLMALGLISKAGQQGMWTLTDYGERQMIQLAAIPRNQ